MPVEFIAYQKDKVDLDAEESEMKQKEAQVFSEAVEGAEYSQVEDRTLYGNYEGFDLLEYNAQSKVEMASLRAELEDVRAEMKESVGALSEQVRALKTRSDAYARSDEKYRAIRHRFLETYRRGKQMERDQARINLGNAAAHRGDAVADALLYTSGSNPRDDTMVMGQIYGLDPTTILLLNEYEQSRTIGALKKHASLEVDVESAIPGVPVYLKVAFRAFCFIVNDELEDIKLGKAHSAAWDTAYNNYTALLNKHKRELLRANAKARRNSGSLTSSMSDSASIPSVASNPSISGSPRPSE